MSSIGPQIDQVVDVTTADGQRLTGLVVDVDGALFAVRLDDGQDVQGETGDEVRVTWHSQRGVHHVLVVIRDRQATIRPLWWVLPVEDVLTQQRRSYVRAVAAGVVAEVAWEGEHAACQLGRICDLSEGGIRVLVADAAACQRGDTVTVTVSGEHARPEVQGRVVRADARGTGAELAIAFDDLVEGSATQLRQIVFAWQRESRR